MNVRLHNEFLGCNDLLEGFQVRITPQNGDCRVVGQFCRCTLEHDGCRDQDHGTQQPAVRSSTSVTAVPWRHYWLLLRPSARRIIERFGSTLTVISLYPVNLIISNQGYPRMTY